MNRDEAVALARVVRSLRPGQHWDAATPDAWSMVLSRVSRADAEQVIESMAATPAWIGPGEIVDGVRKLRADRLARTEVPAFPGDPDDVAGELAWRRRATAAIADGLPVPGGESMPALTGKPEGLALPVVARVARALPAVRADLDGQERPRKPVPRSRVGQEVADEMEVQRKRQQEQLARLVEMQAAAQ